MKQMTLIILSPLNTDNFIKERSLIQKYICNQGERLSRVKSESKRQEENPFTNGY